MTAYDDEQLEQLRHHWSDAYDITRGPDGWQAVRRDNGDLLLAANPDTLFAAISHDYLARPVPRDTP